MTRRKNYYTHGFTLIEILIVIGIAVVLAGLVWGSFRGIDERQKVKQSADVVRGVLEEARSRTLASRNASQYGVHFELGSTTLFVGPTFSYSDPLNEVELLPRATEASDISLTGGVNDVLFERLTGSASATGTITLSLATDASNTKEVSVQNTGVVFVKDVLAGGVNNFTLSVSTIGTGNGTVTSDDSNIDCDPTCEANGYDGELVTLTATPLGGDTFFGWSGGGCSGTGTCQVTMDSDNTITASFKSGGGGGGGSEPVCSPETQLNFIGFPANVSATGGNGTYSWTAPGGSPAFGGGSNFSTTYSTIGMKTITVTSDGKNDTCTVEVNLWTY